MQLLRRHRRPFPSSGTRMSMGMRLLIPTGVIPQDIDWSVRLTLFARSKEQYTMTTVNIINARPGLNQHLKVKVMQSTEEVNTMVHLLKEPMVYDNTNKKLMAVMETNIGTITLKTHETPTFHEEEQVLNYTTSNLSKTHLLHQEQLIQLLQVTDLVEVPPLQPTHIQRIRPLSLRVIVAEKWVINLDHQFLRKHRRHFPEARWHTMSSSSRTTYRTE